MAKTSAADLADLIYKNPDITITKPIVLFSGADEATTQAFTDALYQFDKKSTPKRTPRNVISWAGEVLLFANGYFKGYGTCRLFAPDTKPLFLTEKKRPTSGSFEEQSDFIVLSRSVNLLRTWLQAEPLTPNRTETIQKRLLQSASDLKNSYSSVYVALAAEKPLYDAWLYLKLLTPKTNYTNDVAFLRNVATIRKHYTNNKSLKNSKAYLEPFETFLKSTATDKDENILELTDKALYKKKVEADRLGEFQSISATISSSKSQKLLDYFKKHGFEDNDIAKDPNGILKRQLAILGTSEPKLAEYMGNPVNSSPTLVSNALFAKLYDWLASDRVSNIETVKSARQKLVEKINTLIGQDNATSIQMIRSLTDASRDAITGEINGLVEQQASRGSIFEVWVESHIFNKETPVKITFYLENGQWTETPTQKRDLKYRVIDYSYKAKDKAGNEKPVGVEMKHIAGALVQDQLDQLEDNAAIAKQKEKGLLRIEYLFSTRDAAVLNKNRIEGYFVASDGTIQEELFGIHFITNTGTLDKL